MDPSPISVSAGLAVAYAAIGTAALCCIGHLAGPRGRTRALPTVFAILFFVALTQVPFPHVDLLECPVPSAAPNLKPLSFLGVLFAEWHSRPDLWAFLSLSPLLPVGMNIAVCAVVGAMFWRHRLGLRTTVLLGFGLSLLLELTQLTGIWGLYPCAYRKFELDDLILNTLGVALGFVGAQRWALKWKAGQLR